MTLLARDASQPRDPDGQAVALVLAAGRGERFGERTKQLASLDDQPLIAHVVGAAVAAGVDRIVVVVGHDGGQVAAAARSAAGGLDVEVVDNPDHASGMGSSLAAGAAALLAEDRPRTPDVVVVLLADQPEVGPASVRAVAAAVRGGSLAARASYADGPGHPVAFAAELLPRLAEASGDEGARPLLRELDVAHVLVGGRVPQDVDTPEDLDRVQRGEGRISAEAPSNGSPTP